MEPLVIREDRDGLAILTLNRPEALNALSPGLFVELRQHIDQLAQQTDSIGCVMLCGKGRSFSAGNDLKAIQSGEVAPSRHFQAETLDAIEQLPQPVIAAVQGHCYTGSLELALACDLLVAAESAKFADTHGKWGMSPTWGMSQRLPRRGVGKPPMDPDVILRVAVHQWEIERDVETDGCHGVAHRAGLGHVSRLHLGQPHMAGVECRRGIGGGPFRRCDLQRKA